MAKIIKRIDSEKDMTVFTVIGKVSVKEIVAAITDFYETSITSNVLWDLTESNVSEISSTEVKAIADLSFKYAEKRSSGKTAIVGNEDLTFGLSRMYEMTKEAFELPFETRTFRDIDKARTWLLGEDHTANDAKC